LETVAPAPLAHLGSAGLPDRPSPALDRALDAAERCFARHGVRRTTMSDIAREMGVSRPTLYKQVGSLEDALALVLARHLYAFLDELAAVLAGDAGPRTFVAMAVRAVRFAETDPLSQRVLLHEPELIGTMVTSGQLAGYAEQVADLITPVVANAMASGAIRETDPRLVTEVIARLGATCMIAPPQDLERFFADALLPLLTP
jgi:AcrR family transcriptional regulator